VSHVPLTPSFSTACSHSDVTNNLYPRSKTRGKSWKMRPESFNSDGGKPKSYSPRSTANSLFRRILPLSPFASGFCLPICVPEADKPCGIRSLRRMVEKNKRALNPVPVVDQAHSNPNLNHPSLTYFPRLYGV
jgi:hypothetical protein